MPYKDMKDRDTYPAYDAKPAVKKKRAERNKARRIMEDKGLVHKGDGKDVDHSNPLSKGGKTEPGNLAVKSVHANRAFKRTKDRKPV